MGKFIDLTGQKIGEYTVIKYLGKSMWLCRDNQGNEKKIHSYALRTQYSNYTKINKKMPKDLIDKQFGEWVVKEYIGGGFWRCECSCGNIGKVNTYELENGLSTKCNNPIHKLKYNLKGKHFGKWEVLEYAGNMRWRCRCSCEKHTERDILTRDLINGVSKSCGCERNYHIIKKDITGKTFNYLKVLEYTGKDNMWKCECLACGNIKDIHRDSIVTGKSKSCGCLKEKLRTETLMERYGDNNTTRIENPRETWQIKVLESKENFLDYVSKLDHRQSTTSLAVKLGVNEDAILKFVHKHNIEYSIDIRPTFSQKELELLELVESLTEYDVKHGDRKTLGNGKELDIYIPDLKLAIEFNGNFWHNEFNKGELAHQQKTLDCIRKGIRLIHVFEYEWDNENTRNKIISIIKNALNINEKVVYARNTVIKQIDYKKSKEFLDKYHIQNSSSSSVYLGMYYSDELIGIMTFGIPRFNSNYEWELVRLCFKDNIRVVGGSEKLFKYFINNYNPESIISYCDISKFTAGVYMRLGFSFTSKDLTSPNYIWYNKDKVLTRYQTQKHKLIKLGLGTEKQTENEIMYGLGYIKIYDSGNIKFSWYKNNKS